MAAKMLIRGRPATPWSPTRAARIHLTLAPKSSIAYLATVTAVCGTRMQVGIGGQVETVATWQNAHESIKCQHCQAAFDKTGEIR